MCITCADYDSGEATPATVQNCIGHSSYVLEITEDHQRGFRVERLFNYWSDIPQLVEKMLSNMLLARLPPYVSEIIGDHQCGFRRNRSTIDQIFYIR